MASAPPKIKKMSPNQMFVMEHPILHPVQVFGDGLGMIAPPFNSGLKIC